MNAIDRLFLVNTFVKQGSPWAEEATTPSIVDSIPQWARTTGDFAAGMLVPGYTTLTSGANALKSFGQGDWLGGLGHTALAGIGLIPGFGGLTAGGIKTVGKLMPMTAKGLGAARRISDYALHKVPLGKSVSRLGGWGQAGVGFGLSYPAQKAIDIGAENQEIKKQQPQNIMQGFRNWSQHPIVSNPMFARPVSSMSDAANQFGSSVRGMFG